MWRANVIFPRTVAILLTGFVLNGCCGVPPQPPCGGASGGFVVSTIPADGATGVSTGSVITITFDRAANPGTFDGSISPDIAFDVTWSSDNLTATVTPAAALTGTATYTVTLNTISFADGSILAAPYSFSFTTNGSNTTNDPITTVSDKWALWSSGKTRLRGADMHACTVGDDSAPDACIKATTQQDVADLKNLGANLINASYAGLFTRQPPYAVNTAAQNYMDDLINWAEQVGIYVVIHVRTGPGRNEAAITGFGGQPLTTVWTDQQAHNAWVDMWRYMAERYRDRSVVVGYNLMVEPHVNTWSDPQGSLSPQQFQQQFVGTLSDWNAFTKEITAAIRQVDANTPIIVNSLQWASASWFPVLEPTGDLKTIYSPHPYDPDIYTGQEDNAPIAYPSVVEGQNFNRDWLVQNLGPVLAFSQQHNVPIYVGEYGLFRWAAGGTTFITDLVALFEQNGWNYAHYVWRGDEPDFDGFNPEYGTDRNNHTPVPGNPLLSAFTANWTQNVHFPSP